jgi:predicted oxidoreductase
MPISRIRLSQDTKSPEFSRLVFGAWRLLDRPETSSASAINRLIVTALEAGMTTFDHADIYGNYAVEAAFGAALKLTPGLKNHIQIVTKTGIKLKTNARPDHRIKSYDASAKHIFESVDQSLRNLGTEHIDLLLIHRPDWLANPDEIAETFVALRDSGKCRAFGVSNHSSTQFELIQSRLPFGLVTNQVELSPFHRQPLENGVLDQCMTKGIAPMAWSPLGGGKLFDDTCETARRLRVALQSTLDRRSGLSKEAGLDHAAYAWLLAHPARIIPVIGTGNIERIQHVGIAEEIKMNREEWYEIWTAASGTNVP